MSNRRRLKLRGRPSFCCRFWNSLAIPMPLLVVVALVSTIAAAADQDEPGPRRKSAKTPQRLQVLIDQARALPPEFAADALLRLAAASEISAPTRRELLIEAFEVASRSKYSVPERSLPGYEVDTPDGYLSSAFALGLDELSLQCRAVEGLAELDPVEAFRRFEQVQSTRIPPSSCDRRLVPDLTPFYKVPPRLLKALTPKQLKDGEHVKLLTRLAYAARSPAQVPFVPPLITGAASLDNGQIQTLVGAVADSLLQMERDDLAFRVYYPDLSRNVYRLAELCARKQIANSALLAAFRSAIVRQLSGGRCRRLTESSDPAWFVASFEKSPASCFRPTPA
jgi:hypothetical protein